MTKADGLVEGKQEVRVVSCRSGGNVITERNIVPTTAIFGLQFAQSDL